MAKRKSKKPQQEDTSILLDSPVPQSKKRINSYASSSALLCIIIFTVGASIMGWFCIQQQQSIDQLSESFTTMQKRISNLQQVMRTDAQADAGFGVEERIFALEEAQKQAEEKAKLALATSEKLKNSGLYSQLLTLHEEMDTRLAEMKQVSLSVTTLQAMFKNHSEQFAAMKGSVAAGLSTSLALAHNVAGLTNAVASASSRADKQVAQMEALSVQLEGQASELNELKESMHLHSVALYTNNQEMAAIKELVETKQTMRAQALEEMLNSVQTTLDEQFFTSQTLHSSVMAQLQTFYTQLANAPSLSKKLKSGEEVPAAQNATEVQEKLEDVEEEAEEEDAEDEAGEEAKEEEEEAMQEGQPLDLEQEDEGDVIDEEEEEEVEEEKEEDEITDDEEEITEEEEETTEEEDEDEITDEEEEITDEEEEITEEEEDEDITGQSEEEQEDEAEEEDTEETVLDEFLEDEEELSEEDEESWETEEEESAELDSEDFMDKNEDDE